MPGNSAMQEDEAEDLQSELRDNPRNLATLCLKLKRWNIKRAVYSSAVDHLSNVRKKHNFQTLHETRSWMCVRKTYISCVLTPFHYIQQRFYFFLFPLLNVKWSLYLNSLHIYNLHVYYYFHHESRNKCILLWDLGH